MDECRLIFTLKSLIDLGPAQDSAHYIDDALVEAQAGPQLKSSYCFRGVKQPKEDAKATKQLTHLMHEYTCLAWLNEGLDSENHPVCKYKIYRVSRVQRLLVGLLWVSSCKV